MMMTLLIKADSSKLDKQKFDAPQCWCVIQYCLIVGSNL